MSGPGSYITSVRIRCQVLCQLQIKCDSRLLPQTFLTAKLNRERVRTRHVACCGKSSIVPNHQVQIIVAGRIKAVQLEYTEAHKNLLQAIRKAPQHTAVGFKQTVRFQLVVTQSAVQCNLMFKHAIVGASRVFRAF